ncbi:hypothetical protein [Bradyrhizobium lupini]|uniref:hypothetical protein n=1 Tax=Rhizobium lupini TaxID=136996 RepID=UPI0034C5FEB9
MKSKNLFGVLICALTLVLVAPAYAGRDKSKETPGMAAYHATKGAFKRDRKITRHILRSEREKREHHDRHATSSR